MNAGQIRQTCYDRLGLTSPDSVTVTMVTRAINLSIQEIYAQCDGVWTERSAPFRFVPGTNAYQLWGPTVSSVNDIRAVVDIEDGLGAPLVELDRQTYEDLHRGDTTGDANAQVWCVDGMIQTTTLYPPAITVSVWPRIATTTTTGTLRYGSKPAEVVDADSTTVPQVPEEFHYVIIDLALAKIYAWEDSELSAMMGQKAQASLAAMKAAVGGA
jgi:hypothetical protein